MAAYLTDPVDPYVSFFFSGTTDSVLTNMILTGYTVKVVGECHYCLFRVGITPTLYETQI